MTAYLDPTSPKLMQMSKNHELSNANWRIADLVRCPCPLPQYKSVMPPWLVLHRFTCVFKPKNQLYWAGLKFRYLSEKTPRRQTTHDRAGAAA
jgi:hypothetical protein